MFQDIQSLFDDAQNDGMSANATNILIENLDGMVVAGAQGAEVDDLVSDEVTLFVRVIDVTGSMEPHANAVILAANEQLDALAGSKAADTILMSTWLFNEKPRVLHGYLPLNQVTRLDASIYHPNGTTALFDATLGAFSSVVAYGQQLRNQGIRTKVVVVVITDGDDNDSSASIGQVAAVSIDLLSQEIYTLALVGFQAYGNRVDFVEVAKGMGFPEKNVLTSSSSASDIRHAMGTVSKSVIRASQTMIDPDADDSFFD